jgi:hypothetical protein
MHHTNLLAVLLLATTSLPLLAQQGSATYELVFQSTWSPSTHPLQFPANAHFSPLVGANHVAAANFWLPGSLASPGIKSMAELGATAPLTTELQAAVTAGNAQQVLVFGALGTSPGTQTIQFTVAAEFPLLTLVTMLAPSPDWFVGVHGVSLFGNGDWLDNLVLPLQVYDAGTDSGTTYQSANLITVPPQPVAPVTTGSGPFQGLPGPIGTFTLRRLHGTAIHGCINPLGSLGVSGFARLGQTLTLMLHDPSGAFPAPAVTAIALAAAPAAAFPCGTVLPGFGLGLSGQPGEVLLSTIDALVGGPAWNGAPVPFSLTIPAQPSLAGQRFHLQGMLAGNRIGLTSGLSLLLGN